ncbi:Molybdenum cofactor biosynthesis protein MoaA [invertebrate metagenome]|uniref:GTP 3',8-cyclase n=1 Tax=invertebrate metagenome TaxID=1711999 RepID=A0A484H5S7_9ZZZZ
MFDQFGRRITYLRLSVTDRCDLRCFYCMAEGITFIPRWELCSLEELDRICQVFIRLGVRRIRLTGGEPFVRNGFMTLLRRLAHYLRRGQLEELTLTTNGIHLTRHAEELAALGVRRLNISLDSLRPDRFLAITRYGILARVLDGIAAATRAGLRIRINTVALAGLNEDELAELVLWSGSHGYDICFIEAMPLGGTHVNHAAHYLPLSLVRTRLAQRFTLTESDYRSGGPAHYVHCLETGQHVGFIAPITSKFCESCDRIRLTCTGTLFPCLGQEDSVNLRALMRHGQGDGPLIKAITQALWHKPLGHDFITDPFCKHPMLPRRMSMTGG